MKFIIDFKKQVGLTEINQYFSENNLTVVKEFNNFEKIFIVEGFNAPPVSDIIEHVVSDDENTITLLNTIIVSDQNYGKKHLTGEILTIENNNENWWKSYVIKNPNLDAINYNIDRKGQSAVIYVLDSGIEISHQEFQGRKVSNFWTFNNDFTDKNGHGTAIASVIVGNTRGITDATVKSVKIFDPDKELKQSDMLTALDKIFQDVIDNQYDFSIVNCSWTISKNLLIESKMREMTNAGIFIVAAAGNNGIPISDVTPASMQEVVTIGSFNNNLKPCNFSNYTGASIIDFTQNYVNIGALDGWAPGEGIFVAGLNNTYGYAAGTSISAGIHSAVIAYNTSYLLPEFQTDWTKKDFYGAHALSRKDLLDLSDPKYSNSENRISTVHDELLLSEGIGYNWLVRGKSESYIFYNLFNPQKTIKLEFLSDLPSYITITSSGKLIGKFPPVTKNYEITKIPVKAIYLDELVVETELELININKDFDTTTTTGDPVLDIKLQLLYCSNGFQCYDPNTESCQDNCGMQGSCYYLYPDKVGCGSYLLQSCVCNL